MELWILFLVTLLSLSKHVYSLAADHCHFLFGADQNFDFDKIHSYLDLCNQLWYLGYDLINLGNEFGSNFILFLFENNISQYKPNGPRMTS